VKSRSIDLDLWLTVLTDADYDTIDMFIQWFKTTPDYLVFWHTFIKMIHNDA
jgi:hypothetical protein